MNFSTSLDLDEPFFSQPNKNRTITVFDLEQTKATQSDTQLYMI